MNWPLTPCSGDLGTVREITVATNATAEGEATAHLSRVIGQQFGRR